MSFFSSRKSLVAKVSQETHQQCQEKTTCPTSSSNSKPLNTNDCCYESPNICIYYKQTHHTVDYWLELEELVKEREKNEQTIEKLSKVSVKLGKTPVVSLIHVAESDNSKTSDYWILYDSD